MWSRRTPEKKLKRVNNTRNRNRKKVDVKQFVNKGTLKETKSSRENMENLTGNREDQLE